ncbi:baculoviral IAP repeat-containing protein 7-B-like isoform X2 [Varroa jacobsoni]|uniref:baculoviral IAP repeat-containing protein 7-B-like isoform X2 n=1 Tax=Varroa jacobsoni TaxID=62625 RepID=UPI000BF7A22F|nr:baculoviral IAP repeat-containing protein 7-B-like isoform X2 [Varroa jacobsoni]
MITLSPYALQPLKSKVALKVKSELRLRWGSVSWSKHVLARSADCPADRLRSFGSWPSTAPISKEKVARAGFYYLGNGLETACPVCKLEVSDWAFNDVAFTKHRDRSPQCPFVLKQSSTIVPLDERMKLPEQRLLTFERWPKRDVDPQRLVNAGFYYLNEGDKVRCAWCKGVIEQWQATDVPFEEHARNFSCCPFILNPPAYACRGEDEVGHRNMYSFSGAPANQNLCSDIALLKGVIRHVGPKQPHMVSQGSRMATFTENNWPQTVNVSPEDLVEAGFFFLGMHDYTKCFHCDGGLCNWETGDDPWVEHARWFPECQFVQLSKGGAFIAECQQRHEKLVNGAVAQAELQAFSEVEPGGTGSDSNLPLHLRTELEEIMQSPVVKFYLEKGVPKQVIRMTVKKYMLDNERGFRDLDEITHVLGQVLSFGNKKTAPANEKEQRNPAEIPENVLCRVCMVQERGVVFLPCGHLATCPSCAASVTECVMCRTPIAGTLRTFLS